VEHARDAFGVSERRVCKVLGHPRSTQRYQPYPSEDEGARTLYIEPGSPWGNGYVESFNGKLRDELLDLEIFYPLQEVRVLTEQWRRTYNRIRPHSALGYRPPAPEAVLVADRIPALVGLT
jgi:transposase InsO family protein